MSGPLTKLAPPQSTVPTTPRRASSGALNPTVRAVERDEWRRLAARFQDHNYRQCWDYAEAMALRTGAQTEYVCSSREGEPVGLASLRIKQLPGTSAGIAYVSGGPLVRTGADQAPGSRLDAVLAALVQEYVDRRRFVLRVAPAIADETWNLAQERSFLSAGFRPALQLPTDRTILVDIARPLDDVRAGLAKKWRYHLTRSEKADLEVTQGTDSILFEEFAPLFDEFAARKGFAVKLGADFYAGVQSAAPERERLHVAIARIGDQPVAGVVASMLGDTAVYLLGAANESGRLANAPYLLQWKIIEAAAARDLGWYDLGGIDADANPGVYRFKARMGGTELSAPGPYEMAPGRVRAAAVRTAERLFRVTRARRSQPG